MQEKPKKPQHIPPLFHQIIKTDDAYRLAKRSPIVNMEEFRELRATKRMQMKHAEKIYAGTKDGGKGLAT